MAVSNEFTFTISWFVKGVSLCAHVVSTCHHARLCVVSADIELNISRSQNLLTLSIDRFHHMGNHCDRHYMVPWGMFVQEDLRTVALGVREQAMLMLNVTSEHDKFSAVLWCRTNSR